MCPRDAAENDVGVYSEFLEKALADAVAQGNELTEEVVTWRRRLAAAEAKLAKLHR